METAVTFNFRNPIDINGRADTVAATMPTLQSVSHMSSLNDDDKGPLKVLIDVIESETIREQIIMMVAKDAADTSANNVLEIASTSSTLSTKNGHESDDQQHQCDKSSVISTVGTPRFYGKRKLDEYSLAHPDNLSTAISNSTPSNFINKQNAAVTNNLANSNLSDNINKKARRVQSKMRMQANHVNIKTRNK